MKSMSNSIALLSAIQEACLLTTGESEISILGIGYRQFLLVALIPSPQPSHYL